jgi:hypothetical protein
MMDWNLKKVMNAQYVADYIEVKINVSKVDHIWWSATRKMIWAGHYPALSCRPMGATLQLGSKGGVIGWKGAPKGIRSDRAV